MHVQDHKLTINMLLLTNQDPKQTIILGNVLLLLANK